METVLSLKSHYVRIGPDQPFAIIGERINPTRRRKLHETMAKCDFGVALDDARAQVAAGAHVLDVNAGIPGADEPALLTELVCAVTSEVDVPLCLDSASPAALKTALAVYPGKALINSTTGEEDQLKKVLPLAAEYHAAVMCVLTDDGGIPASAEARLTVANKVVRCAASYGIPPEDLLFDALALPVGADGQAGRVTLDTVALLHHELGVNLSLGASNVSFGLPDRKPLNAAYLALGIARGLSAAITDPTVSEIRTTLNACDLLMGHDEYATRWIKAFRAAQKAAAQRSSAHQ